MTRLTTILLALICATTLMNAQPAQQLPDPGFEDWSGELFKKEPQPKYWHYSNLTQFGFKFNFAHRIDGRIGGKCARIQNTAMRIMGITGGVGPGYLTLGTPWVYVPSVSKVPHGIAGTYGGIPFTSQPDSLEIYIRRTGPNWKDEYYNIIFYSWCGHSHGTAYQSEAGCTELSEEIYGTPGGGHIDEETDIRMLMDPNLCGHVKDAQQIAEACFAEKAYYPNWIRLCLPICYLSDKRPEMCNVTLSSGSYPIGQSHAKIYPDNILDVDDIRLIYASTIDKLVIGGTAWKDFNPHSAEVQKYVLPAGTTKMPAIVAYRGAGTLRSMDGHVGNFPGRKLTGSEMTITPGAINGAPTVITVRAADNSSTHTYQIQFVTR